MATSYALSRVFQLISQIVLARLLSPKDFGVWAMVLLATTLSTIFAEGSVTQVLVQRGLDDKKLVNTVYSLGVNISVGLFCLQTLLGFPLSKFFDTPLLWPMTACVSLVLLIGAGTSTHSAVLLREMKFREAAICSAGASMGRVGGAVVCAALGGGIWSFAAGEISATTIGAWLTRSLSGYHFKYHLILDWLVVREVRSFMSGIMGINLAVSINTKIDNMVIGKMLGAQALGYYNLAYQLAMIPLYTISSINSVNFSVLSQKDNEGRRIYIANALELFAVLSALIYGVGFVVAPWLIPLLYGSEWIEAVRLFQIILVFAYARGFMAILGISLVAADKPGINAAINFALVPITIPSFIVGAQLGGTTGVAIAVAVVLGIFATVWFWIATCHVSDWNIKVLVKPVLLPTVAITLIVAAVLAIPFPTELRIYLQPIVVVITYGMVLTVFSKGHIPQMLMKLVKHTLNKHSI